MVRSKLDIKKTANLVKPSSKRVATRKQSKLSGKPIVKAQNSYLNDRSTCLIKTH